LRCGSGRIWGTMPPLLAIFLICQPVKVEGVAGLVGSGMPWVWVARSIPLRGHRWRAKCAMLRQFAIQTQRVHWDAHARHHEHTVTRRCPGRRGPHMDTFTASSGMSLTRSSAWLTLLFSKLLKASWRTPCKTSRRLHPLGGLRGNVSRQRPSLRHHSLMSSLVHQETWYCTPSLAGRNCECQVWERCSPTGVRWSCSSGAPAQNKRSNRCSRAAAGHWIRGALSVWAKHPRCQRLSSSGARSRREPGKRFDSGSPDSLVGDIAC